MLKPGLKTFNDPRRGRLYDPTSNLFLGIDAQTPVKSEKEAWLGYAHQAETLRFRAKEAGEAFPYKLRKRTDV